MNVPLIWISTKITMSCDFQAEFAMEGRRRLQMSTVETTLSLFSSLSQQLSFTNYKISNKINNKNKKTSVHFNWRPTWGGHFLWSVAKVGGLTPMSMWATLTRLGGGRGKGVSWSWEESLLGGVWLELEGRSRRWMLSKIYLLISQRINNQRTNNDIF